MRRALLLLAGCKKDPDETAGPVDPGVGDGVFAEGCPAVGQSLARVIGVDATLPGKPAVATRGDLLLANQHAAYAITDAVGQATYWYYGGALADAVPMSGCQPGEDKLDEIGFVLAELNLFAVEQSKIRAFRADSVEVIADGSDGGPAVVRATGTDDRHWLVEHTLINDAAAKGGRPWSDPWGTEITVDYTLHPDSPVLTIDVRVTNPGPDRLTVVEAARVAYGETLTPYTYSSQRVDVGGFGFDSGVPLVMATDGEGAYAWGVENATMALIELAGVNVVVDLAQITNGFSLAADETGTVRRFFTVGDGAGATAIEPLLEVVKRPIQDQPAVSASLSGTLRDAKGSPVEGSVRVEARAPDADWGTLDRIQTGPDGAFRAVVPDFDTTWDFRLIGEAPGRDDTEPRNAKAGATDLKLTLPPRGDLQFTVADQEVPTARDC